MASLAVHPGHPAPVPAQRRARRILPARGPNGRFIRAPSSVRLALVAPAAVASEGAKKDPSPAADDRGDAACLPAKRQQTPDNQQATAATIIDDQDNAACPPAKREQPSSKQEPPPATIKVEDEVVLPSIEVWPEVLAPSPPPNTRAIIVLGKRRKVVREVYLSSRAGCPVRPRPNLKLRVTQCGRTRLVRDIFLPPRVSKKSPEP